MLYVRLKNIAIQAHTTFLVGSYDRNSEIKCLFNKITALDLADILLSSAPY